jgi:hypothetical protein
MEVALSSETVMLPLFPGTGSDVVPSMPRFGTDGVEDEVHAYMRRKHRASARKKKSAFCLACIGNPGFVKVLENRHPVLYTYVKKCPLCFIISTNGCQVIHAPRVFETEEA